MLQGLQNFMSSKIKKRSPKFYVFKTGKNFSPELEPLFVFFLIISKVLLSLFLTFLKYKTTRLL